MPAYKDCKRGTWYVKFSYKNIRGERKHITKRGFSTRRAALQYEQSFLLQKSGSTDMTFAQFVEVYREERKDRIRESTFEMKNSIIDQKLIPYFGDKPLRDISTRDVMLWQNQLLAFRDADTGKPYSKSYLKTIHNQLSAIFNHGVRYYDLKSNPASLVGNMGSSRDAQMKFWTRESYLRFAEYMMDDPVGYYYFEMLYWCGIREGEGLALTPADFNLVNNTVPLPTMGISPLRREKLHRNWHTKSVWSWLSGYGENDIRWW